MAVPVVLFHRLAQREYQAARRWYAQRSPQAARRFQDEVAKAVQRIASRPDQGPLYHGVHRWVRTRSFPYLLYYRRVGPDHLLVTAVAHSRRRPGYWLRRTLP